MISSDPDMCTADSASTTGLTSIKISDNSASLSLICLVAWLAPAKTGEGDLPTAFMLAFLDLGPRHIYDAGAGGVLTSRAGHRDAAAVGSNSGGEGSDRKRTRSGSAESML
jgi:hypothetical protein